MFRDNISQCEHPHWAADGAHFKATETPRHCPSCCLWCDWNKVHQGAGSCALIPASPLRPQLGSCASSHSTATFWRLRHPQIQMDREGRMQHCSALGVWASNLVTVIKSGKKHLEGLNVPYYFNRKHWMEKKNKNQNYSCWTVRNLKAIWSSLS